MVAKINEVKKTMKKMMISTIVLASLTLLAGCGTDSTSGSATSSSSSSTNTVEKVDLTNETLRFVGSTSVESMSEKLGDAWVATFPEGNQPKTGHNHTGSGDAFKNVSNGTGDIGLASREFNATEKNDTTEADYNFGMICHDGIAVIVNSQNTVSNVTLQQLRDIYANPEKLDATTFGQDYSSEEAITNWNQLGGADADILPFTRDTSSGTRDGFCTKIGIESAKTDDTLLTSKVSQVTSNGDMVAKVGAASNGIGYCSLEGLDEQTAVKAITVEGVAATEETIRDGSYKLQRNFNYMYPATANGRSEVKMALIESFVAYMGSLEGQGIITGQGGILDAQEEAPQRYKDIVAEADWAVTLGLR